MGYPQDRGIWHAFCMTKGTSGKGLLRLEGTSEVRNQFTAVLRVFLYSDSYRLISSIALILGACKAIGDVLGHGPS